MNDTDTTERPATFTTVNITINGPTGRDSVAVLAETTTTPGMVISPVIGGDGRMTGLWQITHVPSGLALPIDSVWGVEIEVARRVAVALGDVPVDWTISREALAALLVDPDLLKQVREAIKRGIYPPPPGNMDEREGGRLGPSDWPRTSAQATATQMCAAFTRAGLQHYVNLDHLVNYKRGDRAGAGLYSLSISSMLYAYNIVALLRVLAKLDQDAANAAAQDLWTASQAGDSYGELLDDWAREYGFETPQAIDVVKVGASMPDPMDFTAVMAMRLPYPENGTIGSMREEMRRLAELGWTEYTELMTRDHAPLSDEEFKRSEVARGAGCYGWGLYGVLGMLAREYPQIAIRVAGLVDDMMTNGGDGGHDDDDEPPADPPEPAAETTSTD